MTTSPSTPPSTTAPLHQHHADGTTQHFALTTDRSFTVHVHNTDGVDRTHIPSAWINQAMHELAYAELKILLWLARHANVQGQVHRVGDSRRKIVVIDQAGLSELHMEPELRLGNTRISDSLKWLEELGFLGTRKLRLKSRRLYVWWLLYPNSQAEAALTDPRPIELTQAQSSLFDASTRVNVEPSGRALEVCGGGLGGLCYRRRRI